MAGVGRARKNVDRRYKRNRSNKRRRKNKCLEKKTNMYKTNDYIAEATDSLICCYSTVKDKLGKDTGCFSFEPTAIIQNKEKSYIAFGTAS